LVFRKFAWRAGYRAAIPAQVVGERLAELEEIGGGHITPRQVVEDARSDESPLHPAFEWDDEEAAERFREDQARRLIRYCYVVAESPGREPESVLSRVHAVLPEIGNSYVTTLRCANEPELMAQVRAQAIRDFEALRRRYEHIDGLETLFAEVDRLVADAQRKAAKAKGAKAKPKGKRPLAQARN
jgi:hypothetical protein